VFDTIRDELEKLRNKGTSFKMEIETTFGLNISTVKSIISLDDDSITYYDKVYDRISIRISAIRRLMS
jgi:hypothetical protein